MEQTHEEERRSVIVCAECTTGLSIHSGIIASNGVWGLRNVTTQIIPAQSNYWGHASGPFDNAYTDGLGLLNGSGLGDEVSEYVQWGSFLTSAPIFPSGNELLLAIQRNAGTTTLSWDANLSGVIVESIAALGGTNVWASIGLTATNANGRMRVNIPHSTTNRFFRLKQ
jgi:hypothetical protein